MNKFLRAGSSLLLAVTLIMGGNMAHAAEPANNAGANATANTTTNTTNTTTDTAADYSFKFNVTANTSTLKPGDEVTITLGLSNINVGENGINTLQGVLSYDDAVFEKVTSSDISSQNNWTITYNDEETDRQGTFLAVILSGGVKETQTIGTIKLKVKENITAKSTQIKFTQITSSEGTTLVNETDKTISLSIQSGNTTGNTNTTTNTNTGGTVVKPSNTTADKNLPKTGSIDVYFAVAATVLVVAGIVAYINYRKNNTNK